MVRVDSFSGQGFRVLPANGRQLTARRLIIATGLRDDLPDIPGLRERWARDLLHCPYCHGDEARDQYPTGPEVVSGRCNSECWAEHPTPSSTRCWCANGPPTSSTSRTATYSPRTTGSNSSPGASASSRAGSPGRLWTMTTSGEVEIDNGTIVDRTAVFVRPRLIPNTDLLVGMGCAIDDTGWVKVDQHGRTSVPGVWVAGNAANPRAQVITAAGEGSSVAIAVNADLVGEDVQLAVAASRSGALTS